MTHGFEHQIAQSADDSLAPEVRQALDAHLATCEPCRALLAEQRHVRAVLAGRPVVAVRDLSAAVRATLEAERSWIDRLNINWRMWSLRVAPAAVALAAVAIMLVRSVDATSTDAAETAIVAASDASVASALWSEDVSEETLFNLFLRANPDDALSNYVQATPGAAGAPNGRKDK